MAAHVIHIDQAPELEALIDRPGSEGSAPEPGALKSTRYLGRASDDPLSPSDPPFAYYIRRPAGDVAPEHQHQADRVEFVIEGEIEWRERGKPPVVYGAGTLTWVEAGTRYGYSVRKDATILILFGRSPGMNYS